MFEIKHENIQIVYEYRRHHLPIDRQDGEIPTTCFNRRVAAGFFFPPDDDDDDDAARPVTCKYLRGFTPESFF